MKTALLFAHDAGGAENLSLWASKNLSKSYAILSGPAVSVFERNLPHYVQVSFEDAFLLPFNVVTSTSWGSDVERYAIQKAREMSRYCISILDHWVNYEERFLIDNQLVLPNELWATDPYAVRLAKEIFSDTPVKQIDNLYMTRMAQRYRSVCSRTIKADESSSPTRVLYICESINSHSIVRNGDSMSFYGYTEEQAFNFFLENIYRLAPCLRDVTVRLHPSQQVRREEYNWMKFASDKYNIHISDNDDLFVDLHDSDLVVGMESMALAISLFLGKPTVSAIPIQSFRCRLPMKEIVHLSDHVV